MRDTIFALSSGAVPSGVAVIRISGPETLRVVKALCGDVPEVRKAGLRRLKSPGSETVLDEALVFVFEAPSSFTGEDVAELHCHGGRAVVSAVLNAVSSQPNCRPAEAGEFTRRAFHNGRLDLTEVEGLSDLIAAETEMQRRQALRQMGGALGNIYDDWRKRLIHMRAMIEADIDFADEDDVPGSVASEVWQEAAELASQIQAHLDKSRNGERIRTGLQVVLMGAPNAGKSSLLNALAGRDVAIVTEEAGTTRDVIEVHLDLFGYPLTLVDTAGLRDTRGVIEQEGIRRAIGRASDADLILWLKEPGGLAYQSAGEFLSFSPEDSGIPVWEVFTKQDDGQNNFRDSSETIKDLSVSTRTKNGLDGLVDSLAHFAKETLSIGVSAVATRERHRYLLRDCQAALYDAVESRHLPEELRAEDLRRAANALGRITGRIDVEDLLDVVFRDFCIGK
ncbi:tRNA modification GTPase trmE [Roseibium hamelinense]|uniref:tRNA modification GTPase MnmE n=1 Tax=Roseibium hamelinense TaxID=150831 RepID=A0A562SNA8_9HYPH|nr:tRNA uridine-5-carboxymethylaminomethyl(34) synthesis GTPase MnmE [Roseibium hamelinense]MTI43977.1 tRNA uridine-5-carboxymethylaminomethyl(34) synthesis GTPase MnmE [Roseibium hamelinense]TWI82817.1 tRNA modification GTPase trmE [Roseibium hamelinense]